ncbi:ATP synthase I [Segniliparus rotundus DSM 44985]|uniref:ATP synthase I n=1 Tax=Segniliparus rotundus (strain ATCC BAA-972 / CDC 1076 / CIP 108378 / DSM 44985 / JCM 13578) TaxID=640132 RepID=D6ZDB0_SEGRD|nr:ATP synthase subunit I [Segniliparus rotundus]ADG97174.1 ATP synthase I [Segniliparus rotundus DSM 44985]
MSEQASAQQSPPEDGQGDDGYRLPEMSLSLQWPIIMSVVLGMIAIAAAKAIGHPFVGLYACFGLFLGLVNLWLVQRSVAKVTAEANPSKQLMALSSFKRLGIISLFALVVGFLDRPDGLGVFLGLAVFQVVFLLNAIVPVLKGLRQHS